MCRPIWKVNIRLLYLAGETERSKLRKEMLKLPSAKLKKKKINVNPANQCKKFISRYKVLLFNLIISLFLCLLV